MHRFRGFSLLEIMLALIIVSIGISILLTFSTSSQHETNGKVSGNDYSLVVNAIVEEFVNDIKNCNEHQDCSALTVNGENAYTYLAKENTISPEQAASTIDLSKLNLTITHRRSDTPE